MNQFRWNFETVWVARDENGQIIRVQDRHPDEAIKEVTGRLNNPEESRTPL